MAQLININTTEFRRCNLSAIQSGGTWASIVPDANEIILISTTNSLTADGSGECDAYIIGDGTTTATALELNSVDGKLEEEVNQLDQEVNGTQGGEESVTPTFTDGSYKNQQNYQITTSTSGKFSTIIVPAVAGGEIYRIKLAASYDAANYGSYFIFAVSDTTAAITSANISNYVTEIDAVNHIYEFIVPPGTTKFFSSCKTNWKGNVVINKVTSAAPGLVDRVDELEETAQNFLDGNFQVKAVQIDGGETEIGTEDYTISFTDGSYKNQQNYQISTVTQATFSTIIVPAVAGEVVLLKLYSAIDVANYGTYFIFAASDTVGAVSSSQLSTYVQVEDAVNHIYRLTCPAGTTKIFSSVKTANKSTIWAKKVIFTKELKWLLVKSGNIDSSVTDSIEEQTKYYVLNEIDGNAKTFHLWDSIKKKITFSGKKLAAFGDSITYGVSSPGLTVITDCYIKLFCDYAGVSTLINRAASGAPIVYVGDGYSVYERVLAYSAATDIIVIAGGTNDWNQGQPIGSWGSSDNTTVYGALKGICDYLQTNYPDADVIFITPIPYTKPVSYYPNHIAPLDEYRTAIYDVATYYGYSVVSGLDLGMPRERGGWNNTMCDDNDGCHPTARGHALYARSLAGKLL